MARRKSDTPQKAAMREKCDEAGLENILLYVGGNIVIGKQPFDEVEKRFKEMGFDQIGRASCRERV